MIEAAADCFAPVQASQSRLQALTYLNGELKRAGFLPKNRARHVKEGSVEPPNS
jgi:hypothetical protein